MAAAATEPLLTLMNRYYRPTITTPEAAVAHLTENPSLNGFLRPSSDPNKITITYRMAGGIMNSRLKIWDDVTNANAAGSLREMLTGSEAVHANNDPTATAATRRGRRGRPTRRRATRKHRF